MPEKKVAVIDGNSLMHRAFHAVPPTMNAPDGTPTNAVFGFIAMLLKFIDISNPDAIVCAFDAGRPKFRTEALEQYKAQRPPMDPGLKAQFPIIEELLESMSIPVVRVTGWEGDDILGTVAARDEELGYRTLLVSGDKDVYQLCSELTHVVTTRKGITDVALYGPGEVRERYGVEPSQFPDFLGLKGDSSDNIPGVPGVGDKTAAKLLGAYGSLEGIYEHIDELRGKQKERMEENREAAFTSRKVATIVRDLDFPLDLEGAAFPAFSAQAVTEAFSKYRFNSHLTRVLKLVGEAPQRESAAIEVGQVLHGEEAEKLVDAVLESGEQVGVAIVDPEQESLFGGGSVVAVSASRGCAVFSDDAALPQLARLIASGNFAAIDVKAAVHRVYPADNALPALVDDGQLMSMRAFDLGLAGYVLNSSVSEYTYDVLLDTYMGGVLPETKTEEQRAAAQAAAARALVGPLTRALKDEGSERAYFDIDLPLVAVLAIMERTGAAIDVARLAQLGASTGEEIEGLRAQIFELAGQEFNVDSPKQLGHILFEVLGLPARKKTQRGYSTDAKVLKDLAEIHELPALVLRYRELAKIKSTYIDALPRMRAGDGRVHSSFNETVTTTGRLSSSDPNLQNIPVRTQFGRHIRECFIPLEPGCKFLSADYSQIELRLLAHLSGDEALVQAFTSGADFHASTASRVFDVPIDQVTPEQRSRAKAVNFGIVYGISGFSLAQDIGVSRKEASDYMEKYLETFSGVRDYMERIKRQAKADGYVSTLMGRRRWLPELNSSKFNLRAFGERVALNMPIQGTAADVMKLAMIRVAARLKAEGLQAQLILQVHDELIVECPQAEEAQVKEILTQEMEGAGSFSVPLIADANAGHSWAEAKG